MHFENYEIAIYTSVFLICLIVWPMLNAALYRGKIPANRTGARLLDVLATLWLCTFTTYSLFPILYQGFKTSLVFAAGATAIVGIIICILMSKYIFLTSDEKAFKAIRYIIAIILITVHMGLVARFVMVRMELPKYYENATVALCVSILFLTPIIFILHLNLRKNKRRNAAG